MFKSDKYFSKGFELHVIKSALLYALILIFSVILYASEFFEKLVKTGKNFDITVLDPPRKGCD